MNMRKLMSIAEDLLPKTDKPRYVSIGVRALVDDDKQHPNLRRGAGARHRNFIRIIGADGVAVIDLLACALSEFLNEYDLTVNDLNGKVDVWAKERSQRGIDSELHARDRPIWLAQTSYHQADADLVRLAKDAEI